MRTISVSLETHFGLSESSFAYFLLIEPVNGAPEGYTSHDLSHEIAGVLYDSESNQAPSRIPTRLKLNVDAIETTMLFGAGTFNLVALKTGYYVGARFRMFAANYNGDLTDQINLMAGTLGRADIADNISATIELLSLSSPATKTYGRETSPICDIARFGMGRCKNAVAIGGDDKGPDVADYDAAGAVVSVTSAARFIVSGVTGAVGWSDARFLGVLRATSGANYNAATGRGAEEVLKSYDAATGEVTLRVPLPYAPAPGDSFVFERGCDKAWETCKVQPAREGPFFSNDGNGNYKNFSGFPFVAVDKLTTKQK